MFSLQPLYPVTINRLTRLIRLNLRPQPLYGPAMLNSLWAWWQQRLIRLNLQLQPPFSLQPLYPVINRQIRLNLQLPFSPQPLYHVINRLIRLNLQPPYSPQPLYPVINRLIRLNLQPPYSLPPLYPVINRLIRLNLRLQPRFSLQPLYPVINRLIRLNLQLQPPCSPAMLNSLWVLGQQDLQGLDPVLRGLDPVLQGLEYLVQDPLDWVLRVQDSQGQPSDPHIEPRISMNPRVPKLYLLIMDQMMRTMKWSI